MIKPLNLSTPGIACGRPSFSVIHWLVIYHLLLQMPHPVNSCSERGTSRSIRWCLPSFQLLLCPPPFSYAIPESDPPLYLPGPLTYHGSGVSQFLPDAHGREI